MIRATKDFTDIPPYLAKGGTDHNNPSVKKKLAKSYKKKCCYCEHKAGYFEVEHYRPQKIYSWLALEWSNLLWACASCNRGEGGKHDKFPIANQANRRTASPANPADKVVSSAWLVAEGALLLHPKIDNPRKHLTILPNGKLEPINNSPKGKATIEVCNLNRDFLWLDERGKAIDAICEWIIEFLEIAYNQIIANPSSNKSEVFMSSLSPIFFQIKNNRKRLANYALLHQVFYEKFDDFIDAHRVFKPLKPYSINIIKQTFAEYKSQNP